MHITFNSYLNILLIMLFGFTSNNITAQSTFQKAFGGTASDEGKSVRQTTDGGFIIAGTTTSYGAGGRDILVIKTDKFGDTTWTKTYGDSLGNEYGYCVQLTNDGGYIVSGSYTNFFVGEEDIYLLKLKPNGDTSWTRTYGGNGFELGSYIQQTTDGGYIVTGQTPAFGAGGFDAYLIKIDANGNITWTKTYGSTGTEYGTAVQQTTDGGYIITGSNGNTFGFGGSDFYLIKTDASGNHVWSKTYGDSGSEEGKAVKQTTDGGYIIAGSSENTLGPLGPNMCLIKTNSVGDTLWAKLYGGSLIDECYDVLQSNDGGYIMVGKSFSFSVNGDYDVYVVKVNNQGIVEWSKTYGGSTTNHNEIGYAIAKTDDGGYIIAGESLYGFGVGLRNLYLVKIDSLGNSGCNQTNVNTTVSDYLPNVASVNSQVSTGGTISYPTAQIHSGTITTNICASIPNNIKENYGTRPLNYYPNPFTDYLTIEIAEDCNPYAMIVYNIFGQVVYMDKNIQSKLIDNKITIDLMELNSSNYICQLKTNNGVKSFKIHKK